MSPKKVPQKSQKIVRAPLLASPACCKQVAKCLAGAARAHFATCLQQAGEARQDKARHCGVRQGDAGRKARWSKATQDKEGSCEARQSKARQGRARRGQTQGQGRRGRGTRGQDEARQGGQGRTLQGNARQGKAKQGKARQGRRSEARQGETWQGKARSTTRPSKGQRCRTSQSKAERLKAEPPLRARTQNN